MNILEKDILEKVKKQLTNKAISYIVHNVN